MKLLRAHVVNFSSYEELSFDFSNLGLVGITGKTGSGKSSLCDIPLWILFGTTAKNGSVEDIRKWDSPLTTGKLTIEIGNDQINVVRIRGRSNENDLFWTENNSLECHRGKDILETQRLLSDRLGVDSSKYISGSYYHEFNPITQFFTLRAKDRREVLEQLADISFSVMLGQKCKEKIRGIKQDLNITAGSLTAISIEAKKNQNDIDLITETKNNWDLEFKKDQEDKSKDWETDRQARLEELQKRINSMHVHLNELNETLHNLSKTTRCPTCNAISERNSVVFIRTSTAKNRTELELAQLNRELKELASASNLFMDAPSTNPYIEVLNNLKLRELDLKAKLEKLDKENSNLIQDRTIYEYVDSLCKDHAAARLNKCVHQVEHVTNEILENFFDGEFRVAFLLESDNIKIKILKDSKECVFKQLSKGQRQLLKLSFTVSVMRLLANSSTVKFSTLWFDEALDGLDVDLKLKAFNLFQNLSLTYENVLVLDHSVELQSLFNRRFNAELVGNCSHIEEV